MVMAQRKVLLDESAYSVRTEQARVGNPRGGAILLEKILQLRCEPAGIRELQAEFLLLQDLPGECPVQTFA
jgi:hypothetical protein